MPVVVRSNFEPTGARCDTTQYWTNLITIENSVFKSSTLIGCVTLFCGASRRADVHKNHLATGADEKTGESSTPLGGGRANILARAGRCYSDRSVGRGSQVVHPGVGNSPFWMSHQARSRRRLVGPMWRIVCSGDATRPCKASAIFTMMGRGEERAGRNSRVGRHTVLC